ncbi:alpha/beta fold hydrolase [Nocardia sp. NBC_01327]|uniref:alpha/beta fold hydrolase n=1 Tax=Nocardia sp. NBC_01327 TaxID=2903593 RepID=UPI002E0F4F52|nr:alpha/beta hydrolase [Nocardia sp. NBC_01327]
MIDSTTTARASWRAADLGVRREISLPQGRMAVFESGSGRPIVFVHGLLVNANLWRRVVPRLAGEFHCVTVDMPFGSHTLSMPGSDLTPPGMAELICGAIEALGLGPVVLVGNDSGGALCQLVATTRPDLVERLVLTSCDAYENMPPLLVRAIRLTARIPGGLSLLMSALRVPWVRNSPIAFGALAIRPIEPQAADSYVLPAGIARDIRDDLRRALFGQHRRHTLGAAAHFADFDLPVLIAWSGRDPIFPMAHALRLATDFPHARLEVIPGARGFSPEDQPARLATAIAEFASVSRSAQIR